MAFSEEPKSAFQPGLSVVIPYYWGASHLERTLASVQAALARTPVAYEVLIVDDSPNDPRLAELVDAGEVRLIRNATNLGIAAARNAGLRAARYDTLHFLDQDDEISPLFYVETLRRLTPRCCAVLTNASIVKNGRSHIYFRPLFGGFLRWWLTDFRALKYHIYIKTMGQLVLSRNVAAPFVEIEEQGSDDQFAFARLLKTAKSRLKYHPHPLLIYHDHGENYSYSADFDRSLAQGLLSHLGSAEAVRALSHLSWAERAVGWVARKCCVRPRA